MRYQPIRVVVVVVVEREVNGGGSWFIKLENVSTLMIITVGNYVHNWSSSKTEARKNSGWNEIRTHDLYDTCAVLYQLSYQANWKLVTLWVRHELIDSKECNTPSLIELLLPRFQNESWCTAFHFEIRFSCTFIVLEETLISTWNVEHHDSIWNQSKSNWELLTM